MNQRFGYVAYAGIDVDSELKYPKGAGRITFSNQQSYIAAINARFVQLQNGEIDKRVKIFFEEKRQARRTLLSAQKTYENLEENSAKTQSKKIKKIQYFLKNCSYLTMTDNGKMYTELKKS